MKETCKFGGGEGCSRCGGVNQKNGCKVAERVKQLTLLKALKHNALVVHSDCEGPKAFLPLCGKIVTLGVFLYFNSRYG